MSDARIVISADGSQAVGELDRLKQAFSDSMASIQGVTALATKAVGLLAAGGVALSFANSIKEAIDLADQLNKLSQRTGVSTESLSQLQYATKLADVSSESLTTGLKKLNISIASGIAGDKEKVAIFKELGVTLTDTAGRTKSADKVLLDIADTFAISKDGAGKTAAAVALLGKAGDEMIPLLNGGSQAIKDLMKEADKLGLTISDDFAKKAEDFNDNLTRVKISGQKLSIALASDLVDGLGKAMKAMADATIEGGKLAGVMAGLKTLFSGDAQHQNNVAFVQDADRKFALETGLAKLKAAGYTADTMAFKSQIKQLDEVNARLDTTIATRKKLQAEEDKATAAAAAIAKIKTDGKDIRTPPKSGGGDAKEKESEYAKLNKLIQEKIDLDNQSLELSRDLTEAEKFSIKITNDMNLAKVGLTVTERSLIEEKLKAQQILVKEAAWQKQANEENKKYYETLDSTTKSLRDQVKAQQEITDKAGLTAKALHDLEIAKLGNLAADKLMRAVVMDVIDVTGQEGDILRVQAKLYRDMAAQKTLAFDKGITASMRDTLRDLADETVALGMTNAQREIAIKLREAEKIGLDKASAAYSEYAAQITAAVVKKETTDEGIKQQVSMWQTIEGAAKDTFLSIFDSGKNAFTRLKDTLKNGLYALLYEITVKKWLITIAASVSGAGVAQQALGATGAAGGGGSSPLNSLSGLTGGANPFTNFGDASLNFLNTAGGKLFDAGLEKVGGSLIDTASSLREYSSVISGAGDVLGYAGALYSLSQGNYGAALGSAVGTYFGGPIGAAIGSAIGGALFDGKLSASKSTGSLERTYDASGSITSESSRHGLGNGAQVIDNLYARLTGLQQLLGAKGGADFGYGAYSGNGDKNPMGRIRAGNFNSGEVPMAELELAASRAVLAALQSSEMPAGIAKIINSINPATSSAEQIKALELNAATYAQSIKTVITAIEDLPFNSLKGMAFETADALVIASGSLEGFSNNLKSYYDNFYSVEEKRIQTVAEITKKLNAAGAGLTTDQISGMSRVDFRAKFEAPNNSLELNAALLAVSGAFASITPEAVAAAVSITAVSTAISDTMKGLLKDRASLEADLMQAQGNTGGADAARRAIATTGYTDAETAAYDYNAALREEIKTRQDATAALATSQAAAQAAAQAVAAERKTLQDQLNALTDTAAQALTRQRDALNESNKALFDQVQAATKAKAIEQERTELQMQLNTLTDTAAQALTRQRDALSESNKALFDQVQAAQVAKTANAALAQSQQAQADAAKAAADKLAGINAGLQDRLDLLTGAQTQRSLELRAATDDSTKSLIKQTFAQEDLKTANDTMAQAADGAAQALVNASQKIFDQRRTLEQQLFDLTATDVEKAAKSRDGIDPANFDVYDKLVSVQKAAKDATDAATRATEQATAAAAAFTAQMGRFGSGFTLRFDLTSASSALSRSINTAITTVMETAAKTVANFQAGGVSGMFDASTVTTQLTQNSLTVTNKAVESAQNLRGFFTSMLTQATRLEKEITDANTTIGKGVQAINVAKYFADFTGDLNTAFGAIKTAFGVGATTLADSQNILAVATAGLVKGSGQTTKYVEDLLKSIGTNLTTFNASGLETLVNSVGGGATKIGAAITKNILDSISTSVKDNAAFKDLSTSSLAYVGSVVSGVGKGDIQGINDAFVLLSGALSSGKINATQYDTAIGLVTDAFTVGAVAAGTAAESIADAYKRLRDAIKTNEQVAQEQISLEDRLSAATDTTTQALDRVRNAIAPYNRALFDSVIAAEAAKVAQVAAAEAAKAAAAAKAAQDAATATQAMDLQKQWWQLTGNTVALREEELKAIDSTNIALKKQIWAYQDQQEEITKAAGVSDAALSNLQKAMQAEQSAKTATVASIKGVFDIIKSEVDKLYLSVDSTRAQSANEANAFIDTALALAKTGGTVPDQVKLNAAMSAAQSGFGGEGKTPFEIDSERLILAGKLSQLNETLGPQLTTAEKQLAITTNAYDLGKSQLDELRGIRNVNLSVAEAVEALQVAMTGEKTERQKMAALISQTAPGVAAGRSQSAADIDPANIAATVLYAGRRIDNLATYALSGGNIDIGRVSAEIAALQQYIVNPTSQNIPGVTGIDGSHANGLNYVPFDNYRANLHQGERVLTRQENQQYGAGMDTTALESLITRLIDKVDDSNRQAKRTADAVNGNAERLQVVAVAA